MSFDYFYDPDDAEQYSFYRIPKRLITGVEFQDTSTEAKLLYAAQYIWKRRKGLFTLTNRAIQSKLRAQVRNLKKITISEAML